MKLCVPLTGGYFWKRSYKQNRRKRASHGMASFFSLVKIDEIMRAPYGGVFLEKLIQAKRIKRIKGFSGKTIKGFS